MFQAPLYIAHLTTARQFEQARPGIQALLALHRARLLSRHSPGGLPELMANLESALPLLWMITDSPNAHQSRKIYGLASLTDIVPGCSACLHGAAHPEIRKHPAITETAWLVMRYGVTQFGLREIHAEFDADNPGAKGFCHRMGFRKQGSRSGRLVYALASAQIPEIKTSNSI